MFRSVSFRLPDFSLFKKKKIKKIKRGHMGDGALQVLSECRPAFVI